MDLDWSVIWDAMPALLRGARLTIIIALAVWLAEFCSA